MEGFPADSGLYALLTAIVSLIGLILTQVRKNKTTVEKTDENMEAIRDDIAEMLRRIQGVEFMQQRHQEWHMEIEERKYRNVQQEQRRQGHRGDRRN